MLRKLSISIALLALLFVSACEDGPKTCPVFDHPDEPLWDPAVPGNIVVFTNQAGDEVRYELKSTVDDVPASVPARFNCVAYSVSSYYDDEKNVGFEVTLEHSIPDNAEDDTIPIDQQFLFYTVQVVKEDTTYSDKSEFTLNNLEGAINNRLFGGAVLQFTPTRTINGVTYTDVLERDLSGFENVADYLSAYPDDVAWVRVVVAKNAGLVQYELLNGEIYTRMQ